ncbi:MAG: mechanosensitive ion channel family protein [Saprospiraceae bacterium]|nr:mechanosensitive ion channel family protein [Saprospiraceae bacterium]
MQELNEFLLDLGPVWGISIVLVITLLVSFIYNRIIGRYISRESQRDKDHTSLQFMRHVGTALIYLIGLAFALSQIPSLRSMGHSLLAGAGILSVVVGLAAQQSLGNLFSGIMIVIFKPFRINDRITIQNITGFVEDIDLRQVVIRDFENNRVIIPNSLVNTEVIVNNQMKDPKICNMLKIGIGYSSNIDLAFQIIKDEALNHPLVIDNRSPEDIEAGKPMVMLRVVDLADSSVNLMAWIWTKNKTDGFSMMCDLRKSIKERFDREGIEIPFPQRTVTFAKSDVDK